MLFIGVLIALLLLAFITLSYTHSFFGKKTLKLVDTIKKVDVGLSYAMQKEMVLLDTVTLPLGFDDGITVKSVKGYWGVYEKYAVVSTFQKQRISKVVLAGGANIDKPALYLQDMERPLIIAGRAKVTGDAYLPLQGIRPGNISGQSYYHERLIYGGAKQSDAKLPELNKNLETHLNQLVSFNENFPKAKTTSVSVGDNVKNSFKEPPIQILGDRIDLSGISLTGNIIVLASEAIIVDASTTLSDVVLLAPKITIRDKTKGRFQAIASKEIRVGRSCVLEYPSAVIVNAEKSNQNTAGTSRPNITIAEGTSITGILMYLGASEEPLYYPQIYIRERASIKGEVFCTKNLELKGEVLGSVSTQSFIALENGSVYQNHLFNGTINQPSLPMEYSGILYRLENNKTVAQWLY